MADVHGAVGVGECRCHEVAFELFCHKILHNKLRLYSIAHQTAFIATFGCVRKSDPPPNPRLRQGLDAAKRQNKHLQPLMRYNITNFLSKLLIFKRIGKEKRIFYERSKEKKAHPAGHAFSISPENPVSIRTATRRAASPHRRTCRSRRARNAHPQRSCAAIRVRRPHRPTSLPSCRRKPVR